MKKTGVIIILALMLCSSIAAAGFWDKLTGRVVLPDTQLGNAEVAQAQISPEQLQSNGPQGQMTQSELLEMLKDCQTTTDNKGFCCGMPERLIEKVQGIEATVATNATTAKPGAASPTQTPATQQIATNEVPAAVDEVINPPEQEPNLDIVGTGLAVAPTQKKGFFSKLFDKKATTASPVATGSYLSFGQIKNMLSNCQFTNDMMCCKTLKINMGQIKQLDVNAVAETTQQEETAPTGASCSVLDVAKDSDLGPFNLFTGNFYDTEQALVTVTDVTPQKVKVSVSMARLHRGWNGPYYVVELANVPGTKADVCNLFEITLKSSGSDYAYLDIKYKNSELPQGTQTDVKYGKNALYRVQKGEEIVMGETAYKLDWLSEEAKMYLANYNGEDVNWVNKIKVGNTNKYLTLMPSIAYTLDTTFTMFSYIYPIDGNMELIENQYRDTINFNKCKNSADFCTETGPDSRRTGGDGKGTMYVRPVGDKAIKFQKNKMQKIVLNGFRLVRKDNNVKYLYFDMGKREASQSYSSTSLAQHNGYSLVWTSSERKYDTVFFTTPGNQERVEARAHKVSRKA